jgi:hypothetical protein
MAFVQTMDDTLGADRSGSLLAVKAEVVHFFFRVFSARFPFRTERGRRSMRTRWPLQSILYGFQRLSCLLLEGIVEVICEILLAGTLCEVGGAIVEFGC